MNNFIIIKPRPETFMIVPLTEPAIKLEKNYLDRGETWDYPLLACAIKKMKMLESLIAVGD